ncbi:Decarbamoylnovobiocin carbamoyltransferase (Novobiocin biosynthesis protein N) [Durusdinium trenchii]|uniref:Decarbamoylnovobiocin carbamoyltransferase (Novobiocin biosynthesis protein N) n=1 Tax=Durusdinium trenchii TaxID=1381693 RepID=A0ABP0QQ94_9DINO
MESLCHGLGRVLFLFVLLVLNSSAQYDYTVDENGIPRLWAPQKGLLFHPGDSESASMSDDLAKFLSQDHEPPISRPAVIAFHAGHDASIAIGVAGRVQCVLELERLFEVRYYSLGGGMTLDMSEADFAQAWLFALDAVLSGCECDAEEKCPGSFHYAVLENFEHHEFQMLKRAVEPVIGATKWRLVNHHRAHALLGYYASTFRSAFIMSYDAGGNDGFFNFYVGLGYDVKLVAKIPTNMGMAYNQLAVLLPEVTGAKHYSEVVCGSEEITPLNLPKMVAAMHGVPHTVHDVSRVMLSYAGKFMGYSALGKSDPQSSHWASQFVRNYLQNQTAADEAFAWLRHFACEGTESQRVLAASAQAEWTDLVKEYFGKALYGSMGLLGQAVEGIVLTGGCALNVLANQLIYDTFTQTHQLDLSLPSSVYMPPASNDGGIVVGALWSVVPPLSPQPLQYLGFRLFDLDTLDSTATRRQAERLSELGGVDYLADLLAGGPAWQNQSRSQGQEGRDKPIIAVVLGRQEFGPRALGHRSLLAAPNSQSIRDRMNTLKARQFYRPVAPMIADEALEDLEVFGQEIKSPFMTMAPLVRPHVREHFPGLAHVDGTARHQSVSAEEEPWIHSLLLAVGKRIGLAALINTSFNSKGKPIVNTVKECLKMLDELEDLDFVLIEDWLFRSERKKS